MKNNTILYLRPFYVFPFILYAFFSASSIADSTQKNDLFSLNPNNQATTFILALSPGNQNKKAANKENQKPLNKSDNPYSGDPQAIKRGTTVYNNNCGICHNGGGIGAKGPQLIHSSWAPDGPNSDRVMFNIISKGRKGTAMGAFEKHLSKKQIWEIIAYLRNESIKYAENNKDQKEEDVFRR